MYAEASLGLRLKMLIVASSIRSLNEDPQREWRLNSVGMVQQQELICKLKHHVHVQTAESRQKLVTVQGCERVLKYD